MRKLLGLIGLMGLLGLMGYAHATPDKPIGYIMPTASGALPPFAPDHQDTTKIAWLTLDIDGRVFFVDNEYFGERISGYTLPGFVLRPRLVLWGDQHLLWGKGFTIEGGLHWLYLWGARDYPTLLSASPWPVNVDSAHGSHLLPWMQAKADFGNGITLTLGSLGNSSHQLPLPLYDPNLLYVADPEAGAELTYVGKHAEADLWVDWREYIWNRSTVPERFTTGLSGKMQTYWDKTQLYAPFHIVVQHEGGQNMSVNHRINNNFNFATGMGLSYDAGDIIADISCRMMWYSQSGNPTVPFDKGWGLYPELTLHHHGERSVTRATLSYWYGKDFVPLMGSWLFSNMSALTPTLSFDRTQVLVAKASHVWTSGHQPCHLQLDASGYYYPDERRIQYSFGITILFKPRFRLK